MSYWRSVKPETLDELLIYLGEAAASSVSSIAQPSGRGAIESRLLICFLYL